MTEYVLRLSQSSSFSKTTHRQLLSHLQNVGFGDGGFQAISTARFTGFEFVIFHDGIPVRMREHAEEVEKGITGRACCCAARLATSAFGRVRVWQALPVGLGALQGWADLQ